VHGAHPGAEPPLQVLQFGSWWDRHDVVDGGSGRKTLHRSADGPEEFEYATFQTNEDPDLRLTIFAGPADVAGGR
jgi:transcription regulator MmyB-like protein